MFAYRLFTIVVVACLVSCSANSQTSDGEEKVVKIYSSKTQKVEEMKKVVKTDEEWKKDLTEEEYYILRKKGTERAFTGKYNHHDSNGVYLCKACGTELYTSDTKYDSGSGWPSFYDVANKNNVELVEDNSMGMRRVELNCARCGSHLGHMFDDGPEQTGLRYCVNSASLDFKAETEPDVSEKDAEGSD